jgi:rubrerythrin
MTREQAIGRIKNHMAIHKMKEPRAIYITEALNMAIEALEQQRPKGHWININKNKDGQCDDYGNPYVKCSECGICNGTDESNFCPNCGADMRDNPITIPYADSQGLEFADTPTLASAT